MHEAVDHGGGYDVVAECFTPALERFVGGDDQASAFVAGLDQLEEQVGVRTAVEALAELVKLHEEQLRKIHQTTPAMNHSNRQRRFIDPD